MSVSMSFRGDIVNVRLENTECHGVSTECTVVVVVAIGSVEYMFVLFVGLFVVVW